MTAVKARATKAVGIHSGNYFKNVPLRFSTCTDGWKLAPHGSQRTSQPRAPSAAPPCCSGSQVPPDPSGARRPSSRA